MHATINNMTLPTTEEIIALHKKYAASDTAFDIVYIHCQIVWEIAQQLIDSSRAFDVDIELVRVGCLLHDIGVYRVCDADGTLDKANYLTHGVYGYEILKREGLAEAICRMASHHTGVGITKAEIQNNHLNLPPADYLANTPEERLVMYADKFHTKDIPPKFMAFETYSQRVQRFGEHKVVQFQQFREEFGTPDLVSLAKKYHTGIA